MTFIFYSVRAFEPWSWRNSVEQGIGGSETSHVELCWRIARQGHECISYVPLPDDVPSGSEWRGTKWFNASEVDWSLPGVWMLYRCPEKVDMFDPDRKDQLKYLICQDWDYSQEWSPSRVAGLDRIVAMCNDHKWHLQRKHPEFAQKLWCSRNGIKGDLIEEVEAAGIPKRNPRRIMYSSSPDRGLLAGLKIFQRAKEFVPDLEFVATYGFNNIDKLIAQGAKHFAKDKDECLALMDKTGATFLGRIDQRTLYHKWLETAMMIYCTNFYETGFIAGLEAMALGAIPIFSPVHAQRENINFGYAVAGDPRDKNTIAKFAAEVVRVATDEELQERIRKEMMPATRRDWDWEQFAWKKPGENWVEAAEHDFAAKAGRTIDSGVPSQLCDNPDELASRTRWLHLTTGQVMLDIGAADGSWSFPAAEQGATVHAFEPNRRTQLQAAMEARPELPIKRYFTYVGAHNGVTDIGAPIVTLDGFALQAILQRVDYIKIDVEGQEMAVLRGADGLIKRFRPTIMVEVHTETVKGICVRPEQVTRFLDSMGLGYTYEQVQLDYKGKVYYHLLARAAVEETEKLTWTHDESLRDSSTKAEEMWTESLTEQAKKSPRSRLAAESGRGYIAPEEAAEPEAVPPLQDRFDTWGNVAADPRIFGFVQGFFGVPGVHSLDRATIEDPLLKKWLNWCHRRILLWTRGSIRPTDLEIVCNEFTAEVLAAVTEIRTYLDHLAKYAPNIPVSLNSAGLPDTLYGIDVRLTEDLDDGALVVATKDGRNFIAIGDVFDAEPTPDGVSMSQLPVRIPTELAGAEQLPAYMKEPSYVSMYPHGWHGAVATEKEWYLTGDAVPAQDATLANQGSMVVPPLKEGTGFSIAGYPSEGKIHPSIPKRTAAFPIQDDARTWPWFARRWAYIRQWWHCLVNMHTGGSDIIAGKAIAIYCFECEKYFYDDSCDIKG